MLQIWCLSNGSYSLKKCHNPFGKAIQPPPPYGKIPVEHIKSLHGSSLTLIGLDSWQTNWQLLCNRIASNKTREILGNPSLRVEGNSQGLSYSSLGGVRTFSHHQSFYRGWIRKSFPVDTDVLTVLESIFPSDDERRTFARTQVVLFLFLRCSLYV